MGVGLGSLRRIIRGQSSARRVSFRSAVGAMVGAGVVMTMGTSALASSPTLMWRDASNVAVQCLVAPSALVDVRALQTTVCARVRDMAAREAPLPVSVVQPGDPALIAPGTVALLVHVSVQPGADDRPLAAFSIRPFRASSEQTAQLFGAPPRAAPLAADGTAGPALEEAIEATLDQTLPWRDQ